jgi:[protein-PII] uridylyltransferase
MTKPVPRRLKPWKIEDVIDGRRLRVQLTAAWQEHIGQEAAGRTRVIGLLKAALFRGRLIAQERLEAGNGGLDCARLLAAVQDEVIQALYDFTVTHVYRARNPTSAERVAVCATGGYGRYSLAPSSDVDVLFVRPMRDAPWAESVIEYMLYALWDLGLKVGHASRTVVECIRAAREDMTIRTSVLEMRHVAGDLQLTAELEQRLQTELFAGTAPEFIAAKLAERDTRHRKSGESRYMVEPNVKDGKGGLRDLHTLFWIAKYLHGIDRPVEFMAKGVFTREDVRQFLTAAEFLWTVRCHLHYLTGRAEERLTFDLQPEMAARMGYGERAGNPAVERFMKHYFVVTKQVGSLTRLLTARLEAGEQKARPKGLSRWFSPARPPRLLADRRFAETGGRIGFAGPEVPQKDPATLVELFRQADRMDLEIEPEALRLATRHAPLVRGLRADPATQDAFFDVVASRRNPAGALALMNETGVLGRYVPEFGRIVGQTQFNMYHHFTVDEHTLRGIAGIADIEHGRLARELPVSTELFPRISNRRALYLAMLLHDVGKGDGDQQIAGAKAARTVCRRLGLDEEETELVAWLVGHHLVMSDVAQKRDIGDPATVAQFAATVGTLERLRLLLVLTVADIRAVGPGIWSDWKAQLLRDLYKLTEASLRGGRADTAFVRAILAEQAGETRERLVSDPDSAEWFASLENAYWLGFDEGQLRWHIAEVGAALASGTASHIATRQDASRGVTEVLVLAPDRPGLFQALASVFAAQGANVLDARIHTSRTGQAFDVFAVQDAGGEAYGAGRPELLRQLETKLKAVLPDGADLPDVPALAVPKRAAAFAVSPLVMFDNEGAALDTIVELSGRDRPGLLASLAGVFREEGLNVMSAHVGSTGERAADAFYVRTLAGLKLTDPRLLARLRQRLEQALDSGPKEGPALLARRHLATARASGRR